VLSVTIRVQAIRCAAPLRALRQASQVPSGSSTKGSKYRTRSTRPKNCSGASARYPNFWQATHCAIHLRVRGCVRCHSGSCAWLCPLVKVFLSENRNWTGSPDLLVDRITDQLFRPVADVTFAADSDFNRGLYRAAAEVGNNRPRHSNLLAVLGRRADGAHVPPTPVPPWTD
jgi:hypothetical protein